jgi:hypothetical protein
MERWNEPILSLADGLFAFICSKGNTMSKKGDRTAKLAGSSPPTKRTVSEVLQSLESTASKPEETRDPTQLRFVESKFAEGSSFRSLPRKEQQRLVDYLHVYRKELPRLLDEGEAGRFAVIKDREVAHVWDTADDAIQAGNLLIGMDQFAVYQIKPQDIDRLAWVENTTEAQCPQ